MSAGQESGVVKRRGSSLECGVIYSMGDLCLEDRAYTDVSSFVDVWPAFVVFWKKTTVKKHDNMNRTFPLCALMDRLSHDTMFLVLYFADLLMRKDNATVWWDAIYFTVIKILRCFVWWLYYSEDSLMSKFFMDCHILMQHYICIDLNDKVIWVEVSLD